MNILFIYSLQKTVSLYKPLFGQEQIQFGISYISSFLKLNGHHTVLSVLDRKNERRALGLLMKRINRLQPGLICFTAVFSEIEFITKVAAHIKKLKPGIPLMLGGVHVTLNPSVTFLEIFDSICIGEGEHPVLEYVNSIENGTYFRSIANLWVKENERIHKNPARDFISGIDTLPFPDRDMWQEWILEPQTRMTLLLGRGCPYNCSYCCNHAIKQTAKGEYVRLRSPDSILTELTLLHNQYPMIREFFFEVETIGTDMEWLDELCSKLQLFNKNREMQFSTNLRIFSSMNFEQIFSNLQKCGFESVIIGLESGSELIRKNILNRIYSNDDIMKAVDAAGRNKIKIGLFNMIGLPGETLEQFGETLNLNRIIQPHWHSTSIFFPYPGTALFQLVKDMNLLPEKLSTTDERQRAVLELPGFTKKDIQKCFDSFHYEVYKKNKNRRVSRLFIYFIMKFAGHNCMAECKLLLLRILYLFRLNRLTGITRLLGIFQRA